MHDDLAAKIRAGDAPLFEIPILSQTVTLHEWHAMILGGTVGFLCGERDIGLNTIRREPWYALGAFTLAYLIGMFYDPRHTRYHPLVEPPHDHDHDHDHE